MRNLAKELKPVLDEIAAKERQKFENREGIEERLFDSHVVTWEAGKTPSESAVAPVSRSLEADKTPP